MSNVIDYINWRGDLSFEQDPFNEIDNLILSSISYLEIDIDSLDSITFQQLVDRDDFDQFVHTSCIAAEVAMTIFKAAATTKRFGNVQIRKYTSLYDKEINLQFAAMEFALNDEISYIAYRGTDSTIAGWKEDCLMSAEETEAEKEAVRYLNAFSSVRKRHFYVGGHSKGAHLAVYAVAKCKPSVRDKVLNIYSNDGPGFSPEFARSKEALDVLPLIIRIIPEESIVGMLMEPLGEPIIVKSNNKSIMQHNLISWNVSGPSFVRADHLNRTALKADRIVKKWGEEFNEEEKISFIYDLFAVLEASEMDTISEIQGNLIKTLPLMKKRLNSLSPETKEKITDILKVIVKWKD